MQALIFVRVLTNPLAKSVSLAESFLVYLVVCISRLIRRRWQERLVLGWPLKHAKSQAAEDLLVGKNCFFRCFLFVDLSH
ncbi:hypothetical protein D3C80_1845490 [compost metagenome]